MGTPNTEQVQFVISHCEGCAGNFLARLIADHDLPNQTVYRADTNLHPIVLATNQCTWLELKKFNNHRIIVTHNFDWHYLKNLFPNARFVGIYPYTHIGNVLHNICFKKLRATMINKVDNYLLQIKEWHQRIQQTKMNFTCINYWDIKNLSTVKSLIDGRLTQTQQQFFNDYWANQLECELDIPSAPTTIEGLISNWGIEEHCNDWMVAWVIYVYELVNRLDEHQRLWSIDVEVFESWKDLLKIQSCYNRSLTSRT